MPITSSPRSTEDHGSRGSGLSSSGMLRARCSLDRRRSPERRARYEDLLPDAHDVAERSVHLQAVPGIPRELVAGGLLAARVVELRNHDGRYLHPRRIALTPLDGCVFDRLILRREHRFIMTLELDVEVDAHPPRLEERLHA